MIDLAFEDLGLALELASAIGAPAATGRAAREAYEQARAQGAGAQDWTAIYAVARKSAGLA